MVANNRNAASSRSRRTTAESARGERLLIAAGPGQPGHESPAVDFALLQAYVDDELVRARRRRTRDARRKKHPEAEQRTALTPRDSRRVRANIVQYANWSALHAKLHLAARARAEE